MARVLRADRRGPAHIPEGAMEALRDADAIRTRARERGLAEGRAAASAEAAERMLALQAEYDARLAALAPQAIGIGLAATRRLLRDELADRPEAMARLVAELLLRLRRAQQVVVHVHPEDAAALRALADDDELPRFTVEPDAQLERGDCVLRSEVGGLDARVSTRIERLAEALEAP